MVRLPYIIAFVSHIAFFKLGLCAVHDGTLDTLEPWKFTKRFCFVPSPDEIPTSQDSIDLLKFYGMMKYEVNFRATDKPEMMLYYEGFDHWDSVYGGSLTCRERREMAQADLSLWRTSSLRTTEVTNAANYDMTSTGYVVFRATSNAFFFVTLANCAEACTGAFCEGPLQLDYSFVFTNGVGSNKHFSADAEGSLAMAAVFTALYSALSIAATLVARALKRRQRYHMTVRFLVNSINLQMLAVYCQLIDLRWYAQRGVGLPGFAMASILLAIGAEMLLLLMLILVAKGWTIVRRKISGNGRTKIAVLMTTFVFWSLVMQLWAVYKFDEASTAFYYESPPGAFLIVLRFLMAAWFAHAGHTTYKNYRSKRGFYSRFLPVFLAWLVLVPAMLVISIYIDASQRARFALAWTLLYPVLAHVALLTLYNPNTRCNRSFPFHHQTNDMMMKKPAQGGGTTGSEFSQLVASPAKNLQATSAPAVGGAGRGGITLVGRPPTAPAPAAAAAGAAPAPPPRRAAAPPPLLWVGGAAAGGQPAAGSAPGTGEAPPPPLLDPDQVFAALHMDSMAIADQLLRLQQTARDLGALAQEMAGRDDDRDEDFEEGERRQRTGGPGWKAGGGAAAPPGPAPPLPPRRQLAQLDQGWGLGSGRRSSKGGTPKATGLKAWVSQDDWASVGVPDKGGEESKNNDLGDAQSGAGAQPMFTAL